MNWAIKYALRNLSEADNVVAEKITEDVLKLKMTGKPDVLAFIYEAHEIDRTTAERIFHTHTMLDFICGFRKSCLWHGGAITFLTERTIGWGSFATLLSALGDGNANTADHKTFRFATRLLEQMGGISFEREFDRVFNITRGDGERIRLVMSDEYEPTADIVRQLWTSFGPFDAIYNINPNVRRTSGGLDAAEALGTRLLNHSETMRFIRTK